MKDRSFVLEYMLHCADLSACTKPWHQCYKWAYRVLNEFWLEGDEEKRLQLPVGDLNDRNGGSIPAGQVHLSVCLSVCPPLRPRGSSPPLSFARNVISRAASNRAVWLPQVCVPSAGERVERFCFARHSRRLHDQP